MPIQVHNPATTGGTSYESPFIGPVDHTFGLKVNIANLTTAEVDEDGVLKPGVPLKVDGSLVNGAGQAVFGVTMWPIKLVEGNTVALRVGTFEVSVALQGNINRDIAEDNLGRVYSANEIAAFAAAGANFKLLPT